MKWIKTKIFMLLISWLVLHAPTLQAQLLACEQECRIACTQTCLDDVVQLCRAQNPTFPPFICNTHPGYAPQRVLCSDSTEPAQESCESACVQTYPGGCGAPPVPVPGPASVPALSQWVLIFLALGLGGIAYPAVMKIKTVASTAESTQPVSQAMPQSSLQTKDFLIPVAVIIAGGLIGLAVFFGGGSVSQQVAVADSYNTSQVQAVTEDDHIKGSINAAVTIVEFSDFDCPFCSRFHETMNSIMSSRSDGDGDGDGELAWVYRQFPLEQLHPNAPAVALASECVAELGGNDAFWIFADSYFLARRADDSTAHATLISQLALNAGVDQTAFAGCVESGRTQSKVQEDMDDAAETGGRGTPWSILIGPTGKTYPISGALPQQSIEQLIEVALQEG